MWILIISQHEYIHANILSALSSVGHFELWSVFEIIQRGHDPLLSDLSSLKDQPLGVGQHELGWGPLVNGLLENTPTSLAKVWLISPDSDVKRKYGIFQFYFHNRIFLFLQFGDSYLFSCVKLWPWTLPCISTLQLLIWSGLHINRSVYQWFFSLF